MSRAWADGSNDISHLYVAPLKASKKFWVGLFDFNVSQIQTIVNIYLLIVDLSLD